MQALAPVERARQMYAQAREDKRLSTMHRRRARSVMTDLQAFCAAHGIRFVEITKAEAQTSHGPKAQDRS